MEEQVDASLSQERMLAKLAGFFAILALVLACVGLYGVLSYSIARRTREIGVRMALGAGRGDVLGMVLRESLMLAISGVMVGVAGALAVTRYTSSMLWGLTPHDPTTIVGAAALLLAVTLLAAYVPARRAARVDPMTALRAE
jgi:ABC-type antimicrobial peptide transport system permease subunit